MGIAPEADVEAEPEGVAEGVLGGGDGGVVAVGLLHHGLDQLYEHVAQLVLPPGVERLQSFKWPQSVRFCLISMILYPLLNSMILYPLLKHSKIRL